MRFTALQSPLMTLLFKMSRNVNVIQLFGKSFYSLYQIKHQLAVRATK